MNTVDFSVDLSPVQVQLIQKACQAMSLVEDIRSERDVMAAHIAMGAYTQALLSAGNADMAMLRHLWDQGQVPTQREIQTRLEDQITAIRRQRGLTA